VFDCGNNVNIDAMLLCNGIDDCSPMGGLVGTDETTVICDSKCMGLDNLLCNVFTVKNGA
jgi:hypothetical protein